MAFFIVKPMEGKSDGYEVAAGSTTLAAQKAVTEKPSAFGIPFGTTIDMAWPHSYSNVPGLYRVDYRDTNLNNGTVRLFVQEMKVI